MSATVAELAERRAGRSKLKSGQKQKVVVVVDPYSSGRYLVDELLAQDISLVAVQSSLDLADFWLKQLEAEKYVKVILHEHQDVSDQVDERKIETHGLALPNWERELDMCRGRDSGYEADSEKEDQEVEDLDSVETVVVATASEGSVVTGTTAFKSDEEKLKSQTERSAEQEEAFMARTLKHLAEFEVIAVCPGSEPGVFLCEDLQEALGLTRRNGGSTGTTKEVRRHKFAMQERVRECGLRAVRQVHARSAAEVLMWFEKENAFLQNDDPACMADPVGMEGNPFAAKKSPTTQSTSKTPLSWPIIVKPAMSGGADGLYWCHNAADVEYAFEQECGKLNVNGAVNDCLLAQEFLRGEEYIIDAVSCWDEAKGCARHVTTGEECCL